MKTIWTVKKELLQEVESLKAAVDTSKLTITDLEAKLAATSATNIDAITKENTELKTQVESLNVSLKAIEATAKENSELKTQVESLVAQLDEFDKKVSSKALEIVSSTGSSPVNIEPETKASIDQLTQTLNSLSGAEQRAFWETNKQTFLNALKSV